MRSEWIRGLHIQPVRLVTTPEPDLGNAKRITGASIRAGPLTESTGHLFTPMTWVRRPVPVAVRATEEGLGRTCSRTGGRWVTIDP